MSPIASSDRALLTQRLGVPDRPAQLLGPQIDLSERLRVLARELALPIQCVRVVYSRTADGFTDFCCVCHVHGWCSGEYGTAEEAGAQQCQVAIELRIASTRLGWLVHRGFVPALEEVSHAG